MQYNHYDKPNHNQESKFSPLNDPGMNIYPIQSIYYRPAPKKVFPCYTSGTNADFPDYFKLPNLYESKYSIDHSAKKHNKKIFSSQWQTEANKERPEQKPKGRRYIPAFTSFQNNDNDLKAVNISHEIENDWNKKYGVRKFDIISGRNYIPFAHIKITPQKNYFSNLHKTNVQMAKDENNPIQLINRYRKLNGGEYVNNLRYSLNPKFNSY